MLHSVATRALLTSPFSKLIDVQTFTLHNPEPRISAEKGCSLFRIGISSIQVALLKQSTSNINRLSNYHVGDHNPSPSALGAASPYMMLNLEFQGESYYSWLP